MKDIKHTLDKNYEEYSDNTTLTKHMFEGEDLDTKSHFLRQGQTLHSTDNKYEEEVLVFVKGRGKLIIEGKDMNVDTGCVILISANDFYEITCDSSEMVIIEISKIGAKDEFRDLL